MSLPAETLVCCYTHTHSHTQIYPHAYTNNKHTRTLTYRGTHKILISNKKPSSQLESSHLAEKENEHKAALKKITEESDVSSPNKLDS